MGGLCIRAKEKGGGLTANAPTKVVDVRPPE